MQWEMEAQLLTSSADQLTNLFRDERADGC